MKVHVYSNEIELEDYPITLGEAFELLEKQSTIDQVDDNFIGFTFDDNKNAVIQFIRVTDKEWKIDIPTYKINEYQGALTSKLLNQSVFTITRDFFNDDSVFHKSISDNEYARVISHFKSMYGLILELENS